MMQRPQHSELPQLSSIRPRIPLRAHFVWLGQHFPWVNVLAVRSAALRGGFAEVVLHHDSDLRASPHYRELVHTPRLALAPLDVCALWQRCGHHERGLAEVWARLKTPATRSDLIRFALLYSQGGVYLDIDTITVNELAPLCRTPSAFFGLEHVVYPAHVRASRDPRVVTAALLRSGVRSLLRAAPRGWRAFQGIAHLYHQAANCAVLGAEPRAALIEQAIERMFALPPERVPLPCVIGPHLLQQTHASYVGDDLDVHPPATFFPLTPEISRHWFRMGARSGDLQRVLRPETRLVHWYASVRTRDLVRAIDPAYVRRHAHTQLFSELASQFL